MTNLSALTPYQSILTQALLGGLFPHSPVVLQCSPGWQTFETSDRFLKRFIRSFPFPSFAQTHATRRRTGNWGKKGILTLGSTPVCSFSIFACNAQWEGCGLKQTTVAERHNGLSQRIRYLLSTQKNLQRFSASASGRSMGLMSQTFCNDSKSRLLSTAARVYLIRLLLSCNQTPSPPSPPSPSAPLAHLSVLSLL